MGDGSIRVGSDDLKWPLTRVSRSLKSIISQMVRDFGILQHTMFFFYQGGMFI